MVSICRNFAIRLLWSMRKLRNLIYKVSEKYTRSENFPDVPSNGKYRSVVFEGGLGSQILPFLETIWLKHIGQPFAVNLSYFDVNEKILMGKGGADHWSFRLDRYGYSLTSLQKFGIDNDSQQEIRIERNFDLWTSDFWQFSRRFGPELLPVNQDAYLAFKSSLGLNTKSRYSVVHVRRGDYLRVASRIVSDQEWLRALRMMISQVEEFLVISSDSKLPMQTKNQVTELASLSRVEVVFLEGGHFDECDLHDLMREADVLIASNSTFSFTAAILGKQGMKSLVPNIFYGDSGLEEINAGVRSAGTFFVLD
jgi:hypothetical protein